MHALLHSHLERAEGMPGAWGWLRKAPQGKEDAKETKRRGVLRGETEHGAALAGGTPRCGAGQEGWRSADTAPGKCAILNYTVPRAPGRRLLQKLPEEAGMLRERGDKSEEDSVFFR